LSEAGALALSAAAIQSIIRFDIKTRIRAGRRLAAKSPFRVKQGCATRGRTIDSNGESLAHQKVRKVARSILLLRTDCLRFRFYTARVKSRPAGSDRYQDRFNLGASLVSLCQRDIAAFGLRLQGRARTSRFELYPRRPATFPRYGNRHGLPMALIRNGD